MRVAVTNWSAHLPGLPPSQTLGGWAPGPACPPEAAATLLGRKGLAVKEPATRLALCAVHRALGLPAGARRGPGEPPDPTTAVVASSNLGNVGTVAAVAAAVAAEGLRAVSPLAAPNAASNVLPGTVAIWFGYGGPNLLVCSGHPAGLDAVGLGMLLLAAGRADRVVVVGAEPADPTATALLAGEPAPEPAPELTPRPAPGARLRAAAACVVLAPAAGFPAAPVLDPVAPAPAGGPGSRRAPPISPQADPGRPAGTRPELIAPGDYYPPERPVLDLTGRLGQTYGALGVLQVAVAAAILARAPGAIRIVCGDPADGYRTTRLVRHRGSP
jgi:3-oxoacyl-[acyl-carrier-protein] synthase II